jgi:hypothetical protein
MKRTGAHDVGPRTDPHVSEGEVKRGPGGKAGVALGSFGPERTLRLSAQTLRHSDTQTLRECWD